jgi:hypothetical protein
LKHAEVVSKNTILRLKEVPMNDIADTSVRIQTSAEDRLLKIVSFRREQDRRSFFRALTLCFESEQRPSCGAEQRRNAQSFVFTHEKECFQ